jgi:hypothetical protein
VVDKGEEKKEIEPIDTGIYVITSAQAIQSEEHEKKYGKDSSKGNPNINLIDGLERLCKENGAKLLTLSMAGMNSTESDLHSYFNDKKVLYSMRDKNLKLNKNIKISGMIEPPQNMDIPNTRDRFVQKDQSVIMAHTKQRLRCVPTSNHSFPKLIMTTGSCTHPNYNIDRGKAIGNRRADIALMDHQYGAVIVEIINENNYNVRHIPSQKDGKFVDMGIKFDGSKKPQKIGVEALVLGDLHVGETDEITMKANYEMIDFFKPKRLFIHDLVNSKSINPHEEDDCISKAIRARDGELSLEEELKECRDYLVEFGKVMGRGKIFVVPSNHDNFIYRYLAKGDFPRDSENVKIATRLFEKTIECADPAEAANVAVEEGIKMMGNIPKNIQFLKLEDDLKVWGWQLANHGHLGYSGGKGSVRALELCYGKSITGHTHSPERIRDIVVVGTSSRLDLAYTKGQGSKWMAANAILYDGGLVQLLPIINGKWKKKS